MATPSAILTDEHFSLFKNSMDQAVTIQKEINLAKQAGLPVDDLQKRLDKFLSDSKQIKSVYFPGRA